MHPDRDERIAYERGLATGKQASRHQEPSAIVDLRAAIDSTREQSGPSARVTYLQGVVDAMCDAIRRNRVPENLSLGLAFLPDWMVPTVRELSIKGDQPDCGFVKITRDSFDVTYTAKWYTAAGSLRDKLEHVDLPFACEQAKWWMESKRAVGSKLGSEPASVEESTLPCNTCQERVDHGCLGEYCPHEKEES